MKSALTTLVAVLALTACTTPAPTVTPTCTDTHLAAVLPETASEVVVSGGVLTTPLDHRTLIVDRDPGVETTVEATTPSRTYNLVCEA